MNYFENEYDLQMVVQRCHNIIWERHGFDPAQAFDEFSKLLLVKLYCESEGCKTDAKGIFGESFNQFADRTRETFSSVVRSPRYSGIFKENELLLVDNRTIFSVMKELEPYSLIESSKRVGIDLKGTIFEKMIGTTFRGKLGQFFTHRNIIEFMVKLVDVEENHLIYDPACGSGGFLVMSLRYLRDKISKSNPGLSKDELDKKMQQISENQILGTDINERAARVARINLLMLGVSYSGIYNVNALKIHEHEEADKRIQEETFDAIFSNPPFAGYEKDPSILSNYDLGKNTKGFPVSVTREVLFIERIIRLLKPDGISAIVIPQGIFTNRKLEHVRAYIKEHTKILSVIELPDWAFIPSGTSVRGSLLFLQKFERPPSSYSVFMKKVGHIGFTSTGRPTDRNDLSPTLGEYKEKAGTYLVNISETEDRIDAKFYSDENRKIREQFANEGKSKSLKLSEIGSFKVEKITVRDLPEQQIDLIEIGDVDPNNLRISPKRISTKDCKHSTLLRLRGSDILISRRRPYRGAIVEVPQSLDGAYAITEFSVLRVKPQYDRGYVLEIIRSKPFLKLLTIYTTGEMSGRISQKVLSSLKIPMPSDHAAISKRIQTIRDIITKLENEIQKEKHELDELLGEVLAE